MSFCWKEINSGVKSLILILCMLSLMTLSLWDDVATKFLHAAGIISALYFLATPKKTITNNPTLLIFISLCLLGIVNIIWYSHYKVSGSVYTNAYRGPMETGKIALCSAFIFLVLFAKDENPNKIWETNSVRIPGNAVTFFFACHVATFLFKRRPCCIISFPRYNSRLHHPFPFFTGINSHFKIRL